jgi:hypothetical protein
MKKIKKLLLLFFILNTLTMAKETENVNIFISPNVKLSQNELNKDKEELKEIGYKFSEFTNKFVLLVVDHFFENGKDMEKKVLNNIDKDIDFNSVIDYSNYISKQEAIYNLPKPNVESIEMITNDMATIKISMSIPIIDAKAGEDFYQNTTAILNQELKKDVSLSNKNIKKNIDEYIRRFLKIKPKSYNKIANNEIKLHKINGNWEISEIDGRTFNLDNISLTELFELDIKEEFNDIDTLKAVSKEIGVNLAPPEILEGIVVYKNNPKFSISENEIEDILEELKTERLFPYKPYKIEGNKDTLKLYMILIEQDNNKKKGVQMEYYFTYKKENGKWKRQTK